MKNKGKAKKDTALEISRLLNNEHNMLLTLKENLVRDFESGKLNITDVIFRAMGMGAATVYSQIKGE